MPEYPTSINRQTIITFPLNDNRDDITTGIQAGTLYLNKILFEKQLNFGECHSDRFEVTLFDCDDITGETIQVYQLDYTEDEENPVRTNLFYGVVDSCTREDNGVNRKIVAYDPMYTLGNTDITEWWNTYWGNTLSDSIGNVLTELLSEYGVLDTQEIADLMSRCPLFQLGVTNISGIQAITFGTALSYLCQPLLVFPHFDNEGKLHFVKLGKNFNRNTFSIEDTYEDEPSHFEDYATEPVSRVVIYGETDVIAGEYGTGDNVYVFKNNPLLYNLTDTTYDALAETIYGELNDIDTDTPYEGICYTPANVKMILSETGIDLGDIVTTELDGNTISSVVTSIELSGSMFVEQTIVSTGNLKLTPDDFNITSAKIGAVNETATEALEQATTTAKHFVWVPNDGAYVTTDNVAAGQAPTQNYSKLTDTGLYVATSGKEVAHFGIDEDNEPISTLGSTDLGGSSVSVNSEGMLAGRQIADDTKLDYFSVNIPRDYMDLSDLILTVSGNTGYLTLDTSETFIKPIRVGYTISYTATDRSGSGFSSFYLNLSHSRSGYDIIIEDILDELFKDIDLLDDGTDKYNKPLSDWFDALYTATGSPRDVVEDMLIYRDEEVAFKVSPTKVLSNNPVLCTYNEATDIRLYASNALTLFITKENILRSEDYSFDSTTNRINILNTHYFGYTTPLPTAPREIATSCGNQTRTFYINTNSISWHAVMFPQNVTYQMTVGKSVETNQGINTVVVGDNNTVDGTSTQTNVFGIDNTVTGGTACNVLGCGLEVNGAENATIVGNYNEPATSSNSGQFIVGNGTDDNTRHNAMIVGDSVTFYPIDNISDGQGGYQQNKSNALIFNNGGADRTLYVRYQNDAGGTNVPLISVVPTGTNYGAIMGMGASGLTVVGGGESAHTIANDPSTLGLQTTSEGCVVSSDSEVWIITNANTIANYKKVAFRTDGKMQGTAYTGTGKQLAYMDANGILQRTPYINIDNDSVVTIKSAYSTSNGIELNAGMGWNYFDFIDSNGTGHNILSMDDNGKLYQNIFTAGTNVSISSNNVISATDTKPNSWREAGVTDITGTDYSAYDRNGGVSLATGSAKSVGTINLTAGAWIVEFTVSFTANSTGYRSIGLSGTKNDSSYGGVPNRATTWNAGTQPTVLSRTALLYPSTTTRYHILAGHNVGSAITVYPRVRAIKLT